MILNYTIRIYKFLAGIALSFTLRPLARKIVAGITFALVNGVTTRLTAERTFETAIHKKINRTATRLRSICILSGMPRAESTAGANVPSFISSGVIAKSIWIVAVGVIKAG